MAKRKLMASGEIPSVSFGQITINELLEDQRVAHTEPDGKETFEVYVLLFDNSGSNTLSIRELDSTAQFALNVAKLDFSSDKESKRKKSKTEDIGKDDEMPRWPFERALENTR